MSRVFQWCLVLPQQLTHFALRCNSASFSDILTLIMCTMYIHCNYCTLSSHPQAYGFGNYKKVGIILQRGNAQVHVHMHVTTSIAYEHGWMCDVAYPVYVVSRNICLMTTSGILIVSLVCLPVAALWLNTESILLLLHQQPCVARYTFVIQIGTRPLFLTRDLGMVQNKATIVSARSL